MSDFMKKKKEEKKLDKNEKKYGYLKLFLLFAVTVFLVLFIQNLYLGKENYQLNIPVISETLKQEINKNETYNYVRENPDSILYIGLVSDTDSRTFELDFNQIIKTRKLEESITYLNLEQEKGVDKFFKEFNKFYGCNLKEYPSIVIFDEGKVIDILEIPTGDKYKSEIVEKFLDRYQVVNDD